jgi:UV DNA damage endonuclease
MSGQTLAPKLGLVCITASDEIRYRSVTRKRLLTLTDGEQRRVLQELYEHNLDVLRRAVLFCYERSIRLYRISASLFPFADTSIGMQTLTLLKRGLGEAGHAAQAHGIRLVNHPDQFVVLNSESQTVVENSRTILAAQAAVMDLLGQPRTPWATIEIHGGKSGRGPELAQAIAALPEGVRTRIALENDEYAYGADDIVRICRAANVPMVFDAHHHVIHEALATYDHPSVAYFTAAARRTWPDPSWQLVHISNGRDSFQDPTHNDYITRMPAAYDRVPYIEVEAKKKELAIDRLRKTWTPTRRSRVPQPARTSSSRACTAGGNPKRSSKRFHR